MSTLVGMMVGSRKATIPLVQDSLQTILDNIGDDVLVAVAVASYLPKTFEELVKRFRTAYPGRILLFPYYEGSWARFANTVIDMSGDFRWTFFSHDDVRVMSEKMVPKLESILDGKKDPIGWVSFLDQDYLRTGWAPSVREGFHIDAMQENAWSRKKTHHYHSLPEDWWQLNMSRQYLSGLPFDIPAKAVRCHGPFSHFIAIQSDKLRHAIARCEDWSPVSLLIDEDWGLTALRQGLYNIWVTQLQYYHMRTPNGTRASDLISRYGKQAHRFFTTKWKFPHKSIYAPHELREIRKRFGRTLIPWSMNLRSYEWDYLQ